MSEPRYPELVLPDEEARQKLRTKTRRSFLVGGVAAAGAVGFYKWVTSPDSEDEVPSPQRRVLDFNGRLAHSYLSDQHLMPTFAKEQVGGVKPNGNIGMMQPVERDSWVVQVSTGKGSSPVAVPLAEIYALPKIEMITRFCCIEGWSGIAHWGGARFSDFTRRFFPGNAKLPDYVYMATRGEDYYVGLDMKSALHPQTLLAWEQNGKPLEDRRGAPLRLVVPVKYGIKNIKQIALIKYMSSRADDYWAEQGYDWFAGL